MDKRYQVFVSSTFEDLQEERKEVMQALLELDCIPAGMELFPAANDDQWSLIKRVIDDCDYYILIIGGRYGSTNDEGKSYTQMEYEYAVSTGKPVIAFLHKNPDSIAVGKSEQDPEKKKKLEEFKELAKKKLVKYWEGPDNLGSVVSRSMIRLIKDNPAEGWVKANSAIDEKSVKDIARLMKENEELRRQLERVATEAPKGTELLAKGDDTIKLEFTFTGKNYFDMYECDSYICFSWNDLFSYIAPNLIDECSERDFKSFIESLIRERYDWKSDPDFSGFDSTSEYYIPQGTFNKIKIQFRALGLITLGSKKRSAADKQTYWKLTPYGDNIMNQLVAIRR